MTDIGAAFIALAIYYGLKEIAQSLLKGKEEEEEKKP